MMRVTTLALCDAATVRENLLNMLGAGITTLNRPSFPAPLLCDVAVIISHASESEEFSMTLTFRESGKQAVIAEVAVEGTQPPDASGGGKGELGSISLAINARDVAIPKPGKYVLSATLAGGQGSSISFESFLVPLVEP